MRSKIKVVQHFLCNLVECNGSTFYLERRPRGRWLCYKESDIVISQMRISKKTYQTMMRFTSGVECQRWIDINSIEEDIVDDEEDEPTEYWIKRNRNLPAVITPVKKRELAPFIVQIFAPTL